MSSEVWQESYDRHAAGYANQLEATLVGPVERVVELAGARPGGWLLDLATGTGAIARTAAARGASVVGIDVSAGMLEVARRLSPGLDLRLADACSLPFRDGAFDFGLCCLAAHHFHPAMLGRVLAELWRVTRHGVIVSDLTRGRAEYLAARLMALVLRNPLTSHDGPVSVLRAYTPAELREIAVAAGLERVRVRRVFPARMTLIAEKGARA